MQFCSKRVSKEPEKSVKIQVCLSPAGILGCPILRDAVADAW